MTPNMDKGLALLRAPGGPRHADGLTGGGQWRMHLLTSRCPPLPSLGLTDGGAWSLQRRPDADRSSENVKGKDRKQKEMCSRHSDGNLDM